MSKIKNAILNTKIGSMLNVMNIMRSLPNKQDLYKKSLANAFTHKLEMFVHKTVLKSKF
jgi:hypothetical protein